MCNYDACPWRVFWPARRITGQGVERLVAGQKKWRRDAPLQGNEDFPLFATSLYLRYGQRFCRNEEGLSCKHSSVRLEAICSFYVGDLQMGKYLVLRLHLCSRRLFAH